MMNWLRKIIKPENPIRRFWYWAKAFTAAIAYGSPGKRLNVIGVTGTNGKTTTTHMIEHILRDAGKKVAMISTVQFSFNGNATPNLSKLTTISPFATQKFLQRCVEEKIDYVVLETSSHALDQNRLLGIPLFIGVLTNITHEHLDYHHTMEEYKNAKKKLFKNVQTAVLNAGDHYFPEFNKIACPHKISYGINRGELKATDVHLSKYGSTCLVHYQEKIVDVSLIVPGEFNIENALAAVGAGLAVGLDLRSITKSLAAFESVPGRMERIESPRGFEVIVDFGLTPDALEKLYKTVCTTATARVIGVIGATGNRDKEKRPMLGRIVADHCDLTIVTDEEPYTENPHTIMEAVLKGALSTGKRKGIEVELVEDRYQAIEHAVAYAQPKDTIVVTGMGSFQTRATNKGLIPWDERQVVREIIAKNITQ
ncbi:MAG: UDP-N-acetylmuramoyl-L-alanyl-D-glutamate--2,6-diaminopimelate ligase [Candidatus Peregrinibacteria bacterium]